MLRYSKKLIASIVQKSKIWLHNFFVFRSKAINTNRRVQRCAQIDQSSANWNFSQNKKKTCNFFKNQINFFFFCSPLNVFGDLTDECKIYHNHVCKRMVLLENEHVDAFFDHYCLQMFLNMNHIEMVFHLKIFLKIINFILNFWSDLSKKKCIKKTKTLTSFSHVPIWTKSRLI